MSTVGIVCTQFTDSPYSTFKVDTVGQTNSSFRHYSRNKAYWRVRSIIMSVIDWTHLYILASLWSFTPILTQALANDQRSEKTATLSVSQLTFIVHISLKIRGHSNPSPIIHFTLIVWTRSLLRGQHWPRWHSSVTVFPCAINNQPILALVDSQDGTHVQRGLCALGKVWEARLRSSARNIFDSSRIHRQCMLDLQ